MSKGTQAALAIMVGVSALLVARAGHDHGATSTVKKAVAVIEPRSGSDVRGTATFKRKGDKVKFVIEVSNLTPGVHALHLHENGDCSDPEAKSAGAHWNPAQAPHGKWGHGAHLGDIGNLTADAKGRAKFEMTTELWSLGAGTASDVLGKSVIVHAAPDDFTTQPTGNAGGRVGCGVIRAAD